MKNLVAFFLLILCLTVNSQEVSALNFTDLKFGTKQFGDAQWNASACINTTTCSSSAQNVGSMRNGAGQNFTLGATQYLKFTYTNNVAGEPWTITAHNANGSVATVLGTYRIINAGQGYFMTSNQVHPNPGNGTLWSTQKGMISGPVTYTSILQPTQEQMDSLANSYYSPNPIYVAGETYTPPASATPVYGNSAITTLQTTKRTQGLASNPQGHNAIVNVTGDDNLISIQQIGGGGHYVNVGVSGNVNTVDVLQTTTGLDRHYMEATVSGSGNNLTLQQRDSSKTQFVEVTGNSNTVTTNQKGTGNHFLELRVTGNNHNAGVVQDGAGSHNARVVLDGSQPWNFQLNQSGNTGKNYNLPHSMTDGSSVSGTCSAIGGCNLIVNQQ